jgi:hypothetical protein
MKNKLTDLNNHLFAHLERLNEEEISDEQLNKEIQRSKALTDVAKSIISNAQLILDAQKHLDEYGRRDKVTVPELFLIENK